MADAIRFTLLSDEPNLEESDPLGFGQVAAKLAATMLGSRQATPFTLGIEGGWGSGKSSLMRQLAERLAPAAVSRGSDFGWSPDAIEAQAFAYLTARSLKGLPLTFPGTTGVKTPLTGGVLAKP